MAGHHIQWIGSRANASSTPYSSVVTSVAAAPAARPTTTLPSRLVTESVECGVTGNSGPAPSSAATPAAHATGMKLLGFHSNSSSSTASRTAAMGVAKIAAMPPAAPATSSVFRSAVDR